jgi:hypothetical protein
VGISGNIKYLKEQKNIASMDLLEVAIKYRLLVENVVGIEVIGRYRCVENVMKMIK